jgi:hypothetical protein
VAGETHPPVAPLDALLSVGAAANDQIIGIESLCKNVPCEEVATEMAAALPAGTSAAAFVFLVATGKSDLSQMEIN